MVLLGLLLLAAPASVGAQGVLSPLVPERPPPAEPPPESPPPAAAPPSAPAKPPVPPRRRVLSNERSRSRWAYVARRTWARARPARGARRVRRLGLYTPDRTRELVLALEERRLRGGATWVKVRLPMRPNGTTGWVAKGSLGRLRLVQTFLRVDRARRRATLFRRGRPIWRSPIGVGRPRWPTPRGRFYVRERLVSTDPNGLYGPFAFGTSAYSNTLTDWPGGGIIGIHGTDQPKLIPGRISHGCVRLSNPRVLRLRHLMGLGTPVEIR